MSQYKHSCADGHDEIGHNVEGRELFDEEGRRLYDYECPVCFERKRMEMRICELQEVISLAAFDLRAAIRNTDLEMMKPDPIGLGRIQIAIGRLDASSPRTYPLGKKSPAMLQAELRERMGIAPEPSP